MWTVLSGAWTSYLVFGFLRKVVGLWVSPCREERLGFLFCSFVDVTTQNWFFLWFMRNVFWSSEWPNVFFLYSFGLLPWFLVQELPKLLESRVDSFKDVLWYVNEVTSKDGDWRLNQACLHNQSFHKPPKGQSLESFWAGEHVEIWEDWCAQSQHGSFKPSPYNSPCTFLPSGCSLVISFYKNKLVV